MYSNKANKLYTQIWLQSLKLPCTLQQAMVSQLTCGPGNEVAKLYAYVCCQLYETREWYMCFNYYMHASTCRSIVLLPNYIIIFIICVLQ